ncbi:MULTISPECIES: hypothetical protein [unclassified Pseudovibrio]|uniref:hypothetical protein n=1 Tax=unclassified Pseudovibrio TaxID=2627060 RepID=UPI0007AE84AD|nr:MULTISPECIES: hypothetical protein [unclassified Pseudovibrio]KZK98773.1 hypothetical protein PsW74_03362 [Pseudovibrio sp. W74]KZL09266.1 hypothetical protein PsAD14_02327 [Pseudovibrio sp. Ad14]
MTAIAPSNLKGAFWLALLLNLLWINASEVFRYFAFVMPLMRSSLPQLQDVAPMNLPVFMIWGVWDTVLVLAATGLSWVLLERFGPTIRNALYAGSAIWATIFVILWLGLWNMNLATTQVVLTTLPLAWLEMLIAALIVRWAMVRG